MCRRIEEEVEPTVGLPRHRHFVGFFNVPVQTPTREPPFYGYSEKPPHFSRHLRHAWGYGGHILDLNPRVPTGVKNDEVLPKNKDLLPYMAQLILFVCILVSMYASLSMTRIHIALNARFLRNKIHHSKNPVMNTEDQIQNPVYNSAWMISEI